MGAGVVPVAAVAAGVVVPVEIVAATVADPGRRPTGGPRSRLRPRQVATAAAVVEVSAASGAPVEVDEAIGSGADDRARTRVSARAVRRPTAVAASARLARVGPVVIVRSSEVRGVRVAARARGSRVRSG